jgi:formylglycine-generating enzyme required for sulfatase activity
MTDCEGASGESCCTTLEVTGGTYYRTYDLDEDGSTSIPPDGGPTGEADPATVSGFRLDKYLVTVGRFRQFVGAVMATDAGPDGYVPAAGSGKHAHLNGGRGLANNASPGSYELGWVTGDDSNIAPTNDNLACEPPYDTWTATAGDEENLPINCVNWFEAYAFCIWDGGFLPSEAEWEYAAAGGGGAEGQREFPWGKAVPGTTNEYAIYGCNYYAGPALEAGVGPCEGMGNIAPVGTASRGAGRWGQLDLAGELFEWNLDWYAPYADCTDCADLTLVSSATDYRVNRGGLFNLSPSLLVPAYRNSVNPTGRSGGIGFRCARTP